ncbi:MAG TPA: glycosyltransferase family 39 protein [Candidatus Omnitrophota bacterium]|nr:glycosyltransferase family 39 protein [Candidatus Omnitrophota bacterium]HPB67293.1 glycosyltransferase family 39 protein [Candidatus Omnitrophota bacterium]HQO57422.1 glycosyltransferase family 39 protein [Candidatus Omnitrophota bacterium]
MAFPFFPWALFLSCLIVRACFISRGPYHVDTLNLVMQAQATLKDHQVHFLFGFGYPLTVLLAAGFIWMGEKLGLGDPVLAVNTMSVVFSSVTVLLTYYMGKALFNASAGVVSALVLSVSPIFLGLSVYGQSQMPALCFLMAGMFFLIRDCPPRSQGSFFISACFLGLAGAARMQDACLMLPALLFLFFVPPEACRPDRSPFLLSRFWLWAGTALFVAVAFHVPFLFQENRDVYLSQLRRFWAAGLTQNYLGVDSSRLLLSGVYLVKSMTETGMLLSFLGLLALARRRWRTAVFLLLWLLGPLLFYGNLNTTSTSRFFLPVLPPLCLALGFCLSALVRKGKVFLFAGAAVLIIMISLMVQYMLPKLWFRHTTAALPGYSLWAGRLTEPNAVIIAGDEALFMIYYSGRETLVRPQSLAVLSEIQLEKFKQTVNDLISQGRPVYITAPALHSHDKDKHFSGAMGAVFRFIPVGRHIYEDWHLGPMTLQIHHFALYKVERKASAP